MQNYKFIIYVSSHKKTHVCNVSLLWVKSFYYVCENYFLTASFNALPGLKAGTLLAAISISSPV